VLEGHTAYVLALAVVPGTRVVSSAGSDDQILAGCADGTVHFLRCG
jgi:hypothetical protein